MTTQILNNTLYEQDYLLWLEITLKHLKEKQIEKLDWEHLIEEIEALGNEQKNKVDSYLRQVLIHLLLYRYWQKEWEYCHRVWEEEISNFRYELELLFKSKTLYNYFLEEIECIYPKVRKRVIQKTELPSATFPEQCPFTTQEILDPDYLPKFE